MLKNILFLMGLIFLLAACEKDMANDIISPVNTSKAPTDVNPQPTVTVAATVTPKPTVTPTVTPTEILPLSTVAPTVTPTDVLPQPTVTPPAGTPTTAPTDLPPEPTITPTVTPTDVLPQPTAKPPAAINGLTAVAGDKEVNISWNNVSEATSYNIYWFTASETTEKKISEATNPYTHTGLTNDTTYYYMVTSMNDNGESGALILASVTPQSLVIPLAVPTDLSPQPTVAPPAAGTGAVAKNGEITIRWDNVPGATAYDIYWSTVSENTEIKISNVTNPYTHTGLIDNQTYNYVIKAVNDSGESIELDQVSVSEPTVTPITLNGQYKFSFLSSVTQDTTTYYSDLPIQSCTCVKNQENNCNSSQIQAQFELAQYFHANLTTTNNNTVQGPIFIPGTGYGWDNIEGKMQGTIKGDNLEFENTGKIWTSYLLTESSKTPRILDIANLTFSDVLVEDIDEKNNISEFSGTFTTSGLSIMELNPDTLIDGAITNIAMDNVSCHFTAAKIDASKLSTIKPIEPAVTPPTEPTNVTAEAGDGEVTISWDDVTGATAYNIYWSAIYMTTENNGTKISNVTNPFNHRVLNGMPFYYIVTAVNDLGESNKSNQTSAIPSSTITLIFTDNNNGTISAGTGLMWQQQDDDTQRNWQQAIDYCTELTLADYTDWRLPDFNELKSIVNNGRYPAIDTAYFSGTNSDSSSDYYWSSTDVDNTNSLQTINKAASHISTTADASATARVISFYGGSVNTLTKTSNGYARCVR